MMRWIAPALALTLAAACPQSADAFCGFYVSGAEGSLYNNATQAVMMRYGTTTILSLQNNYKGPADDFAMVVPVPMILTEDRVKTLEEEIFAKIDTLSAPRLVEYWEQDPCQILEYPEADDSVQAPANGEATSTSVTVEAEFTVGEYNVVILSATEAQGLEDWLVAHEYNIPEDSAQYLEGYIQQGMYFFVAEVDSEKVEYDDGRIVLSPLRFHYETDDFSLPIRLGLINSTGEQDLLVYTLAQEQRYDVANYPNAFIPTNIEVKDEVRNDFGGFYRSLYSATLEANPGAVVTEYSWDASSCDPCPGPTLEASDYLTLGADILEGEPTWGWTLTRLHARYTPETLAEDLVFRAAEPVMGGREVYDADGRLIQGTEPAYTNNFQGRYIIRHPWAGAVDCDEPNWGNWGGPPDGGPSDVGVSTSPNTEGADPDASTEGAVGDLVNEDVPDIGLVANDPTPTHTPVPARGNGGCGCDQSQPVSGGLMSLLGLLGIVGIRRRR